MGEGVYIFKEVLEVRWHFPYDLDKESTFETSPLSFRHEDEINRETDAFIISADLMQSTPRLCFFQNHPRYCKHTPPGTCWKTLVPSGLAAIKKRRYALILLIYNYQNMNPKQLLTAVFLLVFTQLAWGQTSKNFPTLSALESYCALPSYVEFSQAIKALGFSFEEKKSTGAGTDYYYIRESTKDEITYIERFIYHDFNNTESNAIQLVTTLADLWAFYKKEINERYTPKACSQETGATELQACYVSSTNYLKLYDKRKKFSHGETRNEYRVMVNN